MADISAEIAAFKGAVYGEEVRNSLVALANKLNNEVINNTSNIDKAFYYIGRLTSSDDLDTLGEFGVYTFVSSDLPQHVPNGYNGSARLLNIKNYTDSGTSSTTSVHSQIFIGNDRCLYYRIKISDNSTFSEWQVVNGPDSIKNIHLSDGSVTNRVIANNTITVDKLKKDYADKINKAIEQSTTASNIANEALENATNALHDAQELIESISDIIDLNVPEMTDSIRGGAKLGDGLTVKDGKLTIQSDIEEHTDTLRGSIISFKAKGKLYQDGTPSVDNPKKIEVSHFKNLAKPNTSVRNSKSNNEVLWTYCGDGIWEGNGTSIGQSTAPHIAFDCGIVLNKKYKVAVWLIDGSATAGYRLRIGCGDIANTDDTTTFVYNLQSINSNQPYVSYLYDPLNSNFTSKNPNGKHHWITLGGNTGTVFDHAKFVVQFEEYDETPVEEIEYIPYGKFCVYVNYNNDILSKIFIPYPSKGYAASFSNEVGDIVTIDSAGNVIWKLCVDYIQSYNNEPINEPLCSSTGSLDSGSEIYYTSDEIIENCGYINWPEIPDGSVLTCPELEIIGIKNTIGNTVYDMSKQWFNKVENLYNNKILQLENSLEGIYSIQMSNYFSLRSLQGFERASFQGGCVTSDGILYCIALIDGSNSNAYLLKFDLYTNTLIDTFSYKNNSISLHGNSVFEYGNYICVIDGRASSSSIPYLYVHEKNNIQNYNRNVSILRSSALYLNANDQYEGFISYDGNKHAFKIYGKIKHKVEYDSVYALIAKCGLSFSRSINSNDIPFICTMKDSSIVMIASNEKYSPNTIKTLQNNNILKLLYINGIELATIIPIFDNDIEINSEIECGGFDNNNFLYIITVDGTIGRRKSDDIVHAVNNLSSSISLIGGDISSCINCSQFTKYSDFYHVTIPNTNTKLMARVPVFRKFLHNMVISFVQEIGFDKGSIVSISNPWDNETRNVMISGFYSESNKYIKLIYEYLYNYDDDVFFIKKIKALLYQNGTYNFYEQSINSYNSDNYLTNILNTITNITNSIGIDLYNTHQYSGIIAIHDSGADLAKNLTYKVDEVDTTIQNSDVQIINLPDDIF